MREMLFYTTPPQGGLASGSGRGGDDLAFTEADSGAVWGAKSGDFEAFEKYLRTKELDEASVVSKMETTAAADGKNYRTNFYNLDAIIAVGYRVNSR